jgi:hypothetical protein
MANVFRSCVFGTFSFGTKLAEMTRDMVIEGNSAEWTGLEAESFIRKADEALYWAKSDVRKRMVIARPEGFDQVHPAGQLIIA